MLLAKRRIFLLLVAVTILTISALTLARVQKQPAANESSSVKWVQPPGNEADFAGAETCAGCHDVHKAQIDKTAHASTPVGITYGSGCEACHGPGKAHADAMLAAIGDDAKMEAAKRLIFSFNGSPAENSGKCQSCHLTSQDQQHFERSEHHFNGVACQSCHAAHLTEAAPADAAGRPTSLLPQAQFFTAPIRKDEQRWLTGSLLRKQQPDLCYSCHGVVQSQFSLPSHHRVNEGLMKCTDCHNAHGTKNQPMLKKTNWEGCINCHIEKRGPFVYEHGAVKVEGCTACHSPHGTVSRQLLLRRESRFLCLQCHVDPHAPNVPHGRLSFTTRGECVRCHVTIHGSNHSVFFLN
jgi:predicted CXXCH cytochrome family protein